MFGCKSSNVRASWARHDRGLRRAIGRAGRRGSRQARARTSTGKQAGCQRTFGTWMSKSICADERAHRYFELRVSKRREEEDKGGWARGRLPLGSPWTQRLKRKNREKDRVSIGRVFEARGSN
ncbi:hypothetical protein CRG98_044211 [Punica granatum]|uniref:Uncharacterized protein n=1 Tax=Punica granatum TaxID=22663 RepID=A0A2I0HUL8_PUNGR|nr:hypothetical protein CRG98_044211 [Punica granatum]